MSVLFSPLTLSEPEQDYIQEVFSNPITKKYLQSLAQEVAADMVSAINDPKVEAQHYMQAQFMGKGQLATLTTLLSIQPKE